MSLFFSESPGLWLKTAMFACGIVFLSSQLRADPGSEGPFLGLSGYWSGSGTITMTNGAAERIRCRATYAVNGTGRAVQETLRCASDSYRLEISTSRGVSGSISGRASGSEILANVAGGGFVARLDVRTHGDRQSVTIRPQGGTDVAAVSIALHKT
jgi:hypothetical protein